MRYFRRREYFGQWDSHGTDIEFSLPGRKTAKTLSVSNIYEFLKVRQLLRYCYYYYYYETLYIGRPACYGAGLQIVQEWGPPVIKPIIFIYLPQYPN